jgi:hypothetical protein
MKKKLFMICFMVALSFSLVACNDKNETNPNETENKATENEEKGNGNGSSDEETADQTDKENENTETDQDKNTDETTQKEEFTPVEVSAGGWNVTIEDVIREKSLKNASVVLGYTDATTNEVEQNAPEGYEYYLVKMFISKGDSTETIKWTNMVLTDAEGNVYNRTEDTFLSDLGMTRMPGTDLNFGSSNGWVAYEVKEGATGLTLKYEFQDETLEHKFE